MLRLIPACFKIALARNPETIVTGTVKCLPDIGLRHISWLPLPCLTNVHPWIKQDIPQLRVEGASHATKGKLFLWRFEFAGS